MKDHPLTPMRDANLVRVLQRQTRLPVGLVPFEAVDQGREAIADAFARARADGHRFVIVDALSERHLIEIGAAAADMKLVTGGSGVAIGLPDNFRRLGLLAPRAEPARFEAPAGRAAILAGSCSAATRGQVAAALAAGLPAYRLDPLALADGVSPVPALLDWALRQPSTRPVLIYSTAEPEEVRSAQGQLGRDRAASLVESTLSEVARGLVARGVTRMIVAGGETSGAVIEGLKVRTLEIGPEIDPGVPWTLSLSEPPLALALKSGNFGAPDFFLKAWERLR